MQRKTKAVLGTWPKWHCNGVAGCQVLWETFRAAAKRAACARQGTSRHLALERPVIRAGQPRQEVGDHMRMRSCFVLSAQPPERCLDLASGAAHSARTRTTRGNCRPSCSSLEVPCGLSARSRGAAGAAQGGGCELMLGAQERCPQNSAWQHRTAHKHARQVQAAELLRERRSRDVVCQPAHLNRPSGPSLSRPTHMAPALLDGLARRCTSEKVSCTWGQRGGGQNCRASTANCQASTPNAC